MYCRSVASLPYLLPRRYHSLAKTSRPGSPYGNSSEDLESQLDPSRSISAEQMMRSLFEGYNPVFKPHRLGYEVEAFLILGPSQRMCYYDGKLFGGYTAFLLDRILADCCKPPHWVTQKTCEPAFTAYLKTTYLLPISPTTPMFLRAWPHKVEGRKIELRGCVQVSGVTSGQWVDAVHAEALFIKPKI